MINNLQLRVVKSLISGSLMFAVPCVSLMLSIPEPAYARPACSLRMANFRGAKVVTPWSRITFNQFSRMIYPRWRSTGHFFRQIQDRGPRIGINTPGDLESYMNSGRSYLRRDGRYIVRLNLLNRSGAAATIVYEKSRDGVCTFITMTY